MKENKSLKGAQALGMGQGERPQGNEAPEKTFADHGPQKVSKVSKAKVTLLGTFLLSLD